MDCDREAVRETVVRAGPKITVGWIGILSLRERRQSQFVSCHTHWHLKT